MRLALAALALLVAAPTLAATEAAGSLDGVTIIDRLDVNDIAAGSTQRFWFRAGMSPVGQPWLVPVVVIKGAQPGPRLLLSAGIHGDELNGIAVLHRLAATVDPAKLAGTLTLVPGLNPPGLLQSTRQWTPDWSRSAPNLNRELPGKEGGSAIADFAGRLWSRLIRPNADSAVDLHTQSRGTAYMMYAFASTPRTRRMAELVAPDIIKMDKGDKGTVENTLTDDGVPAITLELGRPEMFDDTMIARAESGLKNLMREMKMLPGKVTPPPAGLTVANDGALLVSDNGNNLIRRVGGYSAPQILPDGLYIDALTGVLSGTPSAYAGVYTQTGPAEGLYGNAAISSGQRNNARATGCSSDTSLSGNSIDSGRHLYATVNSCRRSLNSTDVNTVDFDITGRECRSR